MGFWRFSSAIDTGTVLARIRPVMAVAALLSHGVAVEPRFRQGVISRPGKSAAHGDRADSAGPSRKCGGGEPASAWRLELPVLNLMKILVANISSTSLKWRLYDFTYNNDRLLHKGSLERVTDYPKAIEDCLAQLRAAGAILSEKDLAAVGFRPVMAQGVVGCVQIDESVLKAMEAFNSLAPADNPPCINGIRLFAKRLPDVPLVGLFETAFYGMAPEAAMRYAVPDAWYRVGVRRWGFHGASHKFIAERSRGNARPQ